MIPKVESTSKFGEWAGGEKDEKETIVLHDNTSSAGTGFWTETKSDGTFSGNNCKDWSTGKNSDNVTLSQSYKFCNFLTFCYWHFLFVAEKTGTIEFILKENNGQVYTTTREICVI